MRINHYSTIDARGGAALATLRLHLALRERGADSTLYVREKLSREAGVEKLSPLRENPYLHRLKRWINKPQGQPLYTFNLDEPPRISLKSFLETRSNPGQTVSVIHWIDNFLDVISLRRLIDHFQGSVIWMIHDLEPFTGGCHYSFECQGFTTECGSCPQLKSTDPYDRANRTWKRKQDLLGDLEICFIAPTVWGESRVRESSLFSHQRVVRIPLPIDTAVFRPYSKSIARDVLHLPPDARLLLCGASYIDDPRKGMDLLIKSLQELNRIPGEDIRIILVGQNGQELRTSFGLPVHYLGEIVDPLLMALVYQSADVFLCPSLADSGPLMIPESLLCGTPVVAFPTGGAPDWIKPGVNGYLAEFGDARDFARGIESLLGLDMEKVATSARDSVELLHRPDIVADQHLQLYRELLKNRAA